MNSERGTGETTTSTDRRTAPRVELRSGGLRVKLSSLADFLDNYAQNISSSGMFVASEELLEPGTEFQFSFELGDGGDPFEGVGEVRWLKEDGESRGMGVHFLHLSPAAWGLVRTIIQAKRKALLG